MAHLKTAKDAARFDWVGVFARDCAAPKVGPAIGNYNTDPASSLPSYYEVVWVIRVK